MNPHDDPNNIRIPCQFCYREPVCTSHCRAFSVYVEKGDFNAKDIPELKNLEGF